jgi:hypothetical protein
MSYQPTKDEVYGYLREQNLKQQQNDAYRQARQEQDDAYRKWAEDQEERIKQIGKFRIVGDPSGMLYNFNDIDGLDKMNDFVEVHKNK